MNEISALREYAPEAPAVSPDTLIRARADLMSEISRSQVGQKQLLVNNNDGLRRRRLVLALGIAAALAVGSTAMILSRQAPSEQGQPVHSPIVLVEFQAPAFPFTLALVPAGMAGPYFSGSPQQSGMGYQSGDTSDYFNIGVGTSPPVNIDEPTGVVKTMTSVAGKPAILSSTSVVAEPDPTVTLAWERMPGQWVSVIGGGRFGNEAALQNLADNLVDVPQPVKLQVNLAPSGWSVGFYKDDRILTLVDNANPERELTVFTQPEFPDRVPDIANHQVEQPDGPIQRVTVQGQPAEVIRTGYGWYAEALFPDGTMFVLQAPADFSFDDVVAIAGQVTHTV